MTQRFVDKAESELRDEVVTGTWSAVVVVPDIPWTEGGPGGAASPTDVYLLTDGRVEPRQERITSFIEAITTITDDDRTEFVSAAFKRIPEAPLDEVRFYAPESIFLSRAVLGARVSTGSLRASCDYVRQAASISEPQRTRKPQAVAYASGLVAASSPPTGVSTSAAAAEAFLGGIQVSWALPMGAHAVNGRRQTGANRAASQSQ